MKVEIKVPRMGESISEAVIGTILKESGSAVKNDEEIVELETDKVNQVVYAPKSGKLTLTVKVGDKVPVDSSIGYIETDAAVSNESAADSKEQEKKTAEESKGQPSQKIEADQKKHSNVTETPKQEASKSKPQETQQPAESKPIRLTTDAFVKEFQAIPQKSSPQPGFQETTQIKSAQKTPESTDRESRRRIPTIRKAIAKRLVEAQHEAAMLTTFNEVDMSSIIGIRTQFQDAFTKKYGVKLGFMSFFVEATISALKAFPLFNSYLDGEEIVQRNYYDLGIAVSTDKGLLVPVLRNCDKLTMPEIEKQLEEYAKKAREGKISLDELQGGGFTITNGGVFGSMLSTPILNAPQCGILGMHKIQKRAVVVDDQIVIRPIMYLALSYDHRLVDGKEAVSFLVHIKNMLESPPRILLEV